MVKFLKDVNREMRKVSWPKGNELTRYTIIVLVTVIFFGVFFTVTDLVLSQILELF
ncbi:MULTISPECIES: preprotein translocase subunit SecE [Allobacillus]|uniref:Protein translocase subunit SecE n=1 Tax=Allobacillus halotolerans TaxID=570278 RepID=A0ABS6GPT6_9BACI|nr:MULTISPECIES: preprotein translocase subunit SecE [Allobacillus]MBU6081136.1 preprotein translocase subunit SecE [Allobacillus halotolerans]TSJ63541.1 preprotein translocase subunit SecE [Allobacillus sp. SKP2-8]